MEVEESSARVADDAAGVVGAGDDLDRAGESLVGDGVPLGRPGSLILLEDVDRLVHVSAVSVGGAPAVQIAPAADQWEHVLGPAGRRGRHEWESFSTLPRRRWRLLE